MFQSTLLLILFIKLDHGAYFTGPSLTTWEYAKYYCQSLQSVLGSMHSQSDYDIATAVCKASCDVDSECDGCWIGLNDVTVNGSWTWVDGTNTDYTNWSPGEPKDSHQCVLIGKWDNFVGWDDVRCDNNIYPLCSDHFDCCNKTYQYPLCKPDCMVNNTYQLNARIYTINDDCYQAIGDCSTCLDELYDQYPNPPTNPKGLHGVSCVIAPTSKPTDQPIPVSTSTSQSNES